MYKSAVPDPTTCFWGPHVVPKTFPHTRGRWKIFPGLHGDIWKSSPVFTKFAVCTKVLFLTLQAVSGVPMWFQKHSLTQGDGGNLSPGYTGIFGCHPRFLRNLPESTPSFHICAVIVTHIDERTRRVLLHTRLG